MKVNDLGDEELVLALVARTNKMRPSELVFLEFLETAVLERRRALGPNVRELALGLLERLEVLAGERAGAIAVIVRAPSGLTES